MKTLFRFVFVVAVLTSSTAHADDRPGDALLAEYFKAETAKLQDACLDGDWKNQAALRQQLAEMLGLDPMPERTPLEATVTGTMELEDVVIEKLHFQSRPGLYVTANLYRPKTQDGPLPAILNVCGHAKVTKDGVSFGNKTGYHHFGAWFARNGYVCLVIDTLQLGEIEGIHHGTYRYNRWWWNSRGYTPAGVECWNGMRAIDYLQSRPEVDGEKIGVTGRSGGGAYSWYIAAMDERIKAAVPTAGITDLRNHIVDDCIEGHCDCMFFVNTYRWDYPRLAALVAPRPLLIANSDKDEIFPLDGVVRTHAVAKKIYDAYDAAENLGLHITEGPHRDTQELRIGAFLWFERFLKGDRRLIDDRTEKFLKPEQLKVFVTLPADERNTTIDESFVTKAPEPKVPESSDDWAEMRDGWLSGLNAKTFRGWNYLDGAMGKTGDAAQADGLVVRRVRHSAIRQEWKPGEPPSGGSRAKSEHDPFVTSIYVINRTGLKKPSAIRLHVLDAAGWKDVGPVLGLDAQGKPSRFGEQSVTEAGRFAAEFDRLNDSDEAIAFVAPRGIGPTAWTGDVNERIHVRRRFMLLGQTLDGMRVLDVRRAIQGLIAARPFRDTPISVHGTGDAAVHALYASLFEPEIARVELTDLPTSHREGPGLLNVLRILDVPQTVALAAERCPVVLHTAEPKAWSYPQAVAESLDWGDERVQVVPTETAAGQ
ncbi:MAG: CocE/NonD family hydrolase [Planctomycetaceae bacterium]